MNKIPKLRFPEFSGEWSKENLNDISLLIKDGTHGTHQNKEIGIPLLSAKDIKNGKILTPHDSRKISLEEFSKIHKNYKLKNNDLLLTLVGTIGEVAIIKNYFENYTFQRSVGIIRLQKEKMNHQFAFQYVRTDIFQNQLKNKANSSAQAGVYLGELSKTILFFPSLPEQEEIASFLSSVDSKIEKLERKKELWEQYKKGMMQKIFSQELRFRDENGEDYPEWEEKKICEITLKLYQGINTAADKVEYSEEGIPILQAKHITSGKLTFEDTKYLNIDRYSEYTKNYIPEENEILFSNIGTIGKSVLIKQKESFLIAWNILKITLNLSKIYPSYFLQTLKFFDYRKVFSQLETGNATKFINKGDFENIPINLPSLPEQTQIADFLTSLDSKIEVVEKELAGMKEFKKGLLQKMFV